MKTLFLICTLLCCVLLSVNSQNWDDSGVTSSTTDNIIINGKVGVGTTILSSQFNVSSNISLGTVAGNYSSITTTHGIFPANKVMLNDYWLRESAGSDWNSVSYIKGISVDASFLTPSTLKSWIKQFPYKERIDFGSSGNTYLSLESNKMTMNGAVAAKTLSLSMEERSTQITSDGYGRSSEILFGAYRSGVAGWLENGTTKYSFAAGGFSGGAGAIRYVGNGGRMNFFISPEATAADDAISWGDPKMTILRNGNVGIGKVNPTTTLHITQPAISEAVNSTTYPGFLIESTSTTRTIGEGAAIGFVLPANTDGSSPYQQGRILVTPDDIKNNSAAGRMYIQTRYWTGTNSDWRNNLVLLSNGFVGIGTSAPDKELTVNGSIHAKEVIVDLQIPLADYVFEPTYNLKPLAEVEKFVKEEKHLPEMPSAAEVAEKGLNMGEMQNKLLEKIEELTLYVIELEKINKAQEEKLNRVDKLEKDLELLKSIVATR